MGVIKLIKKCMIDNGRDDFTNYLAEILGVTKQWASAKLNNKSEFTMSELQKIVTELNIDAEELKAAIAEN